MGTIVDTSKKFSFLPFIYHNMTTAAGGGGGQAKKPDLGLLEEDDEFEEFPAEDWGGGEEDSGDINVWEDNWDDDNIEDDFSRQLRAELEQQGQKTSAPEPMKTQ